MTQQLAILGSTGSIGTQTLAVMDEYPADLKLFALAAGHNLTRLQAQIDRYHPQVVGVADAEAARELSRQNPRLEIVWGEAGLTQIAAHRAVDTAVVAITGIAGLAPAIAAAQTGKRLAIATKEALVAAGELVTAAAAASGAMILPVDSEHNAIFQCLQGVAPAAVERIILTASGGPFRGWQAEDLAGITPAQAVRHPNWAMGRKISVDSATLVNKGLEVMEARWLFGLPLERIDVVVHPESIVHSLVELVDGSVLAQLGHPDMRLPIQYALTYPERKANKLRRLNLSEIGKLTFAAPDLDTFPGLKYAYQAGQAGGTLPAVYNAANEAAVEFFLAGRLSFPGISRAILETIEQHQRTPNPSLEAILAADRWARQCVAAIADRE